MDKRKYEQLYLKQKKRADAILADIEVGKYKTIPNACETEKEVKNGRKRAKKLC